MRANDHLRAPPAFQQYASDLLANEDYRLMSLAERGLLGTLRLQSWVSGSVPGDCTMLAQLTGIPEDQIVANLTPRVRKFFEPIEDGSGRLCCPELVKQRARMEERRAERARSGRKGAKAKWGKENREMAQPMVQPSPVAIANAEKKRTEFSREGTNRKASSGNGPSPVLSPDNQAWSNDYENSETSSAQAYREASGG